MDGDDGLMHSLTKEQARRIAIRAQLLDEPRPTDLLTVVQRLVLGGRGAALSPVRERSYAADGT